MRLQEVGRALDHRLLIQLQHGSERVIVEQVPELEVFPQHVEGLVPTKALKLRGVGAGFHAGAQRATA